MKNSDRTPLIQGSKTTDITARQLSAHKQRVLRGDPIAIYEAILLCSGMKMEMPDWLANHLLGLISEYHLGKKPSWKGAGNRPIIIIRRRLEIGVKRRAVTAVRAWMKNRELYQDMPTRCIKAWICQDYHHSYCKKDEDALEFASFGLQGVKLQEGGPTIKCSSRTLRRAMKSRVKNPLPDELGRIAKVFGLTDPDEFFGADQSAPPNLK